VIEELREERRKIREAGQAGVEILDAEVDAEYARMARRMNISTAQLTANLAQEGVSPETIKHRLRAELAWQRYQKERQQAQ
jgi:peptidyl-prolyl cis-trans isomerase SurA